MAAFLSAVPTEYPPTGPNSLFRPEEGGRQVAPGVQEHSGVGQYHHPTLAYT